MANIVRTTPPATLALIVANVAIYLLELLFARSGMDAITNLCALHYIYDGYFHLWQFLTYMFLHGNFAHLFFNMFALWMFGVVIERTLGTKRFLIYYFVCGVGAGLCQEVYQFLLGDGGATIGASGACYGVLLAFGVLYPNERIMLLIPPIPMKAKYFIVAYIVLELVSAFSSNDNVAHVAHLGGMLFGWALLVHWRHKGLKDKWRTPSQNKPKESYWERVRKKTDELMDKDAASHTNEHSADYDYNLSKKQNEERLNAILDKIKASGYDSLTAEEKQFLFSQSNF